MENLLHQTLDFDSEASESRSAYQPSPNAVLAKKNGIRSSRNCASATGKNNQNASKSIHPKNEDFADFCQKRLKRFQTGCKYVRQPHPGLDYTHAPQRNQHNSP